jgi:hypothetical protein
MRLSQPMQSDCAAFREAQENSMNTEEQFTNSTCAGEMRATEPS